MNPSQTAQDRGGGVLTEIERKLLCILTEYAKNEPSHIDIDLHADLRTWKGKGRHLNNLSSKERTSLIPEPNKRKRRCTYRQAESTVKLMVFQ